MLSFVNEWLCFHIINDFVYFIFLPTNWGFIVKQTPHYGILKLDYIRKDKN